MRWSPERLRWVLLAGVIALAAVIAALFGLANYRAGKIWQRILARNGVNIQRESNGVTYSQSKGGRTIFTVHAAKSVPHGDGQWTLHDAVLILYGKNGRNDRIRGNQFDYDEKQGVLRALGEVHLDLQAPTSAEKPVKSAEPALSFTPDDETAADPALIHVRTSGLVYRRKLDVAETDQPTEFRYKDMTCTSRGAEFDAGQNLLHLMADVHLAGMLRNAPFTLTATHADLDRNRDVVDLQRPVAVSGKREALADHALLHLQRNGTIETGDADGSVQVRSGTETMESPRLHGVFGAQNRPREVQMAGGVRFADADPARPAEGAAQTVDLQMDAEGLLRTVLATGNVGLRTQPGARDGGVRQVSGDTAQGMFTAVGAPLHGALDKSSRRSVLDALKVTGHAVFADSGVKRGSGADTGTMRVSADALNTTFENGASGRAEPQRLTGSGHTRLEQMAADGGHQLSTGDALDVSFAQRPGGGVNGGKAGGMTVEVARAVQTGAVVLRAWPAPGTAGTKTAAAGAKTGAAAGGTRREDAAPTVGQAARAVFVAAEGTLTLTGGGGGGTGTEAQVEDAETQMRAPTIVLHQGTGDAEASGGVAATTGGAQGAAATHVLAERAALLHAAQISEFFGSEARPAQLWQGGSQVRAAKITLDGAHHTLSARPEAPGGVVNAVFASARPAAGKGRAAEAPGGPAGGGPSGRPSGAMQEEAKAGRVRGVGLAEPKLPEASRDAIEVRAGTMDFNDLQHEAVFNGGVQMRGTTGVITGDHGAAFLAARAVGTSPAPKASTAPASAMLGMGGQLERMVVLGNVRLQQPERTGTGAQLTYTAASNSYVLTGTPAEPPRVVDAQRGVVTGTTLIFGAADNSIVVAGQPANGRPTKPARVHTETDLKQ